MSAPTEHDFIEKCKQLIECRLGWKGSHEWKNRDYEYLSDLITEKTKIAISVSTLKRIWRNDPSRIPHVSTLNALGMFLDYSGWNDFKTKLKDEVYLVEEIESPGSQKKTRWIIPVFVVVFGLMVAGLAYFIITGTRYFNSGSAKVIDTANVVFTSKKTVTAGLPNTVVFQYDISKINADSAFIQQDWDKRKRARISKENHYHTSIYYYPGYYTARLVVNDQIVKEHPLFITTDGWIAVYKKEFEQEIPVYLKNIELIKENQLHVTVDDLAGNKIVNDKDFFIGFYHARDFGAVTCDSFSFETEVKNDPAEGGLTCQYTVVTVEAERGLMTASFADKGCTSNLFLMFGDVYVDGSENDLSAFGTDLSDWHRIRYVVVNKNVQIYLDDKEIHQLKFSRDIGKIISISYHFYGCGAVKMVNLFDSHHTLLYHEDFN